MIIKMFKIFKLTFNCSKSYHLRTISYTSSDYCLNLVRSLDNENFMCTLLLPSFLRTAAMSIRAFNAEVASVQDLVSQSHLGLLRLKFWDECIDKIYNGKVQNNPVAVELAKTVQMHKISKPLLKKLVASRIQRLDQTSFQSVREMETYADATCSPIFRMLLEVAKVKNAEVHSVASSLGTAQGLSNLLRGVPHNATKRVMNLPTDLLAHYDVTEESVFRRTHVSANLSQVVRKIANSAQLHLNKARESIEIVPQNIRSIFLPAIPVDRYLVSLNTSAYDVFEASSQYRSPLLPIRLYYNFWMKSY